MPRRKCVFNKNLEAMFPFLETTKSNSHLHCLKCNGRFSIASGGRSDILTHLRAKKHIKASKLKESTGKDCNVLETLKTNNPRTNDIEMCRTCKKHATIQNAKNLFQKDQEDLVAKIIELTSSTLPNEFDLPSYFCESCEEKLKIASEFRALCLESFAYFDSIEYKDWLQKNSCKTLKTINENFDSKPEPLDPEEMMVEIKEEVDSTDTKENDMLAVANEIDCKTINDSTYTEVELTELKDSSKVNPNCDEKTEPTKTILKNSIKYLKAKANLICEHCGNHFTSRQHFLTHLRRHMNYKPYKCEICPKQCYTSTELKRHMRRHTGEKPFVCKHCQRRFTDQSTLIKHERMHTNERPFSCSQCEKAFTTSYGLKNHILVHTGERPFQCTFCKKAFQRQTHLTTHYRSIMHKQMLEKQRKKIGAGPAT